MLVFEKIILANFMSVGNAPLTIDYLKSKSTIVTASNGTGKSSLMLDSITFALYGKAYRNINKNQLINSINQKGLMTEVHFRVNKTKYVVKRGIKPAVMEIYKNGKLLNQDAATRDYQRVLEQTILKMNYRTFTQVVIMGTGNYIPFMRLTPGARREFVEDILDIKVFSVMNQLLKQRVKDHSDHLNNMETQIKFLKEKIKMQLEFVKKLETEKEDKKAQLEQEINRINRDIADYWSKIELLSLDVEQSQLDIQHEQKLNSKKSELMTIARQVKSNIEKNNKDKEFYATTEICPMCHQEIEEHHRQKLVQRATSKIVEFEEGLNEIESRLVEFTSQLAEISKHQTRISELQSQIGQCHSGITVANSMLKNFMKQMDDVMNNTGSIDTEKSKMTQFAKELTVIDDEKKAAKTTESYYDTIATMLKDTGIKTRIIKQYVPIFNKLINRNLQQLDLFVEFNLDENFNETVKSRYRDAFTYESFSEGEKQRIDLALLFVFREIARLKSAVNCNILIMDEVLDSSLDSAGVDNFFNIINTLTATNLFVISHREGMIDKFDRNMKLVKKGNFTQLSD